jgi:hypothetical protein
MKMKLFGEVPKALLLGLTMVTATFFVLAERDRQNLYWSNFATDSIVLLVGLLVVDRMLARHERAQWQTTDRYVNLRILRFVDRAMTRLRLALGIRYSTLIDTKDDIESISRVMRKNMETFAEKVERNLADLLSAATPEGTLRLIAALHQLEQDADRLVELFAHRLEPAQATSILKVSRLVSDVLRPLEAIPELTDPEAAIDGRRETCWGSVENLVVNKATGLSRELRTLGDTTMEVIPADPHTRYG